VLCVPLEACLGIFLDTILFCKFAVRKRNNFRALLLSAISCSVVTASVMPPIMICECYRCGAASLTNWCADTTLVLLRRSCNALHILLGYSAGPRNAAPHIVLFKLCCSFSSNKATLIFTRTQKAAILSTTLSRCGNLCSTGLRESIENFSPASFVQLPTIPGPPF
jgi:hypothetical protein